MKIIIPSKGRAGVIHEKALRLFPRAIVCVGDDEIGAYSKVSDNLLVHPANVVGIGPLRQWVLDNVKDRTVVMVDDDVTHAYSQVGFHKLRIERPPAPSWSAWPFSLRMPACGCLASTKLLDR